MIQGAIRRQILVCLLVSLPAANRKITCLRVLERVENLVLTGKGCHNMSSFHQTRGNVQWLEYAAFAIFILLASLMAGMLRLSYSEQYSVATLPMLMDGQAYTPFQYRMLMPLLLKWVERSFAVNFDALVRYYETLMIGLGMIAIAAYGVATGLTNRIALVTGCAYFFIIPFLFIYQPLGRIYYPSDTASVVFMAFALWAMVRKQTTAFLVIFGFGLLNRESIALLLPLALWHYRSGWRASGFWWLGGIGVALVLASKIFLVALYAGNQGAGLISLDTDSMHKGLPTSWESSRAYANLSVLATLDGAVTTASVLGFIWIPLAICYRQIHHAFVSASLVLCLASFVLMFFVGNLYEPRIFCDLAPIVLVAVTHWVQTKRSS
jgi:hypothetical protein